MSRRISIRLLVLAFAVLVSAVSSFAQTAYGGYSPYTIFGVGDMSRQGTAYNKSMGGVGIANRNTRYLNIMNPASLTARDSLAVMADFSMNVNNTIYRQGDLTAAKNVTNMNDFVISFPVHRKAAIMVGITPYSDTGFGYSSIYTDQDLIATSGGDVTFTASGSGSIYKGIIGGGVMFFNRLSLGAEFDYYFGNITKNYYTIFSNDSYNSLYNGTDLQVNAIGGKFGLQYEQPIAKNYRMTLGATYSTNAKIKGYYEDYRFSESSAATDTLSYKMDTISASRNIRLASEIGVGISFRKVNKWMIEFDYVYSDWRNSGVGYFSGYTETSNPFSATVSHTFRAGFEYIPNINDIRYYLNRVAYRGGAYYRKEHYTLYGSEIYSAGLTFGATLPINRMYNGVTFSVELGQRGALKNNLIRERYINISIGINIFDIWFQRPQYE